MEKSIITGIHFLLGFIPASLLIGLFDGDDRERPKVFILLMTIVAGTVLIWLIASPPPPGEQVVPISFLLGSSALSLRRAMLSRRKNPKIDGIRATLTSIMAAAIVYFIGVFDAGLCGPGCSSCGANFPCAIFDFLLEIMGGRRVTFFVILFIFIVTFASPSRWLLSCDERDTD